VSSVTERGSSVGRARLSGLAKEGACREVEALLLGCCMTRPVARGAMTLGEDSVNLSEGDSADGVDGFWMGTVTIVSIVGADVTAEAMPATPS
jgi:hypothetical protein